MSHGKSCHACGYQLSTEYEYLGEIRVTPDPVFYKGHPFCQSCFDKFMECGWLVQELQGKVVRITFLDMHSFVFSTIRWERIDKTAGIKEVRSWCRFYSKMTYSQVHMVKVYSKIKRGE